MVFLYLGTNTQKVNDNNHTKKKNKEKMEPKQTTMVKSVRMCPQRKEIGTCP